MRTKGVLAIALLMTTLCSAGLATYLAWDLVADPDRRARQLGTQPPPVASHRFRSAFWNNGSRFMPADWTAQPARDSNLASSSYVLERLRREAAPPALIRTIFHNVVREQFPTGPILEFLQQAGDRTPEEAEAAAAINRLLYGDLTLEQSYLVSRAVGQLVIQGRKGGLASEEAARKELEVVLSPSQLVDVLRYNFPSVKALQETLASIDATEAEYLELADAVIAREQNRPGTGNPRRVRRDPELAEKVVREFHEVLGDERFLAVVSHLSPRVATIREVYRAAGIPASTQARLILKAQAIDTVLSRHESGADKGALDRSLLRSAHLELTAAARLNSAQVSAFDQTEFGGVLKRLSAAP